MSNSAIQQELEELRAQVAELTQARDSGSENIKSSDKIQPHDSAEEKELLNHEIDGSKMGTEQQIQELIDALEVEIKDTNPVTMLIFFTLGILFGRFLPR
jgi:hypothetical protein